MTPLQLGIMLHYYCTTAPYKCKTDTHLIQQDELNAMGLLDFDDDAYSLSVKGRFWMDHILTTPLPVERFEIPEREKE